MHSTTVLTYKMAIVFVLRP